MKHFITLALSIITIFTSATAQNASKPVQFSFSAQRADTQSAIIKVHAAIKSGFVLFAAKQKDTANAFVSALKTSFAVQQDKIRETGKETIVTDADNSRAFVDSVEFSYPVTFAAKDSVLNGSFAWLAKGKDEYPSGEEKFSIKLSSAANGDVQSNAKPGNELTSKSLGAIFWLCFGTGLLAILTPCVFPLIPVTVSFFLKRSKTRSQGIRNAAWYSISIILIYTIPTLILTKIFGDKILYQLSVHPVTNLLFFAIFILFGISLLGAYELTLPSKWANNSDQQAGKGGFTGIFFMALTLVIVSFSCTGPIVGLLLGSTAQGGTTLAPILGMLGFGLGLALPFTLFAFFPSLMQSLPKSGGWLNSVKVAFGFIELALALKFLSNVDLIYHWRLLDREVFLVLWIVIATLLGLYLLGKLKFSHDSDLKYINIPRLFFAIATFSFAVYLVPGLWGAPLKKLSGLVPPSTTQDFNLDELQYKLSAVPAAGNNNSGAVAKPPQKLVDKLKVPFGLTAYFDLEEGMAAAKALNKPVMLDFTGHSCTNCRKMEESVWKNPEVLKRMKEDFVLISLYTDESEELPENEQYRSKRNELIANVGDKNLDYEITKFGFNAQPLYMFLDLQGNILSDVKYGYDPDVNKFLHHFDTVKAEFAKRSK